MTTHEARPPLPKKSFASVAAAAATPRSQPPQANQELISAPKAPSSISNPPHNSSVFERNSITQMQNSMSKLDVEDTPVTSKALDEHAKSSIKRAGLRFDDDSTLVSNSTNTNSYDGKSTASGTAFAFDEKESLRPDDSASVQAVDDDEIGFGPFSGAPSSRVGSEAGSRAFQDQFIEVSANIPTVPSRLIPTQPRLPLSVRGESTPRQTQAEIEAPISGQPTQDTSLPRAPMSYVAVQPDEKLFEALDSPKDRLFLLRLEKMIIEFIQNGVEPKIQLPSCNSFCRLLAHKMADYYGLTHYYETSQSAVNLLRTPYCRIRTPISEVPRNAGQDIVISPSAPVPTMTIMRRPDLNKDAHGQHSAAGTTESSVVASKAGSEVGEDNVQGTGATSPTGSSTTRELKGSLTLSQREARYKLKREQLFGPQTENGDADETANEISRVSSRSEKKGAKKKNRQNNDDFEGRSEYFPTVTYSQNSYPQSHHPPGYIVPYGYQAPMHSTMPANGYHTGIQDQGFPPSMYSPIPAQGFPPLDMQGHPLVGFGNHLGYTGYDQQPTTQYAPMYQQPQVVNQAYAAVSPSSMDGNYYGSTDMQTPRVAYSHPFQAHEQQVPQSYQPHPGFNSNQAVYPHGANNAQGMNVVPGTYARPSAGFNPQTRSFVPNGATAINTGYPSTGAHVNLSNGSFSKGHTNGNQLPHNPLHQSTPFMNAKENSRSSLSRKHTPHTNGASSPSMSSLAKWGAPATLPAKPPPPDAAIKPESLPVKNQFNHKPQAMMTGQPMPQFHNGVYSMPGGRQHG